MKDLRSCQLTFIGFILFGLLVIGLIFTFQLPDLAEKARGVEETRNSRETATSKQETKIVATENYFTKQTELAPTSTTTNTFTPTTTITLTATPSKTPSNTPTPVACTVTLIANTKAYVFPSRGFSLRSVDLEPEKFVITKRIADRAWWPVLVHNSYMWIPNESVNAADDCTFVATSPISEFFPENFKAGNYIDESFYGLTNSWSGSNGKPLISNVSKDQDHYLDVQKTSDTSVTEFWYDSLESEEYSNFQLAFSYKRHSTDLDHYFGIRFMETADQQTYYELRIYSRCRLEIDEVRDGHFIFRLAEYDFSSYTDSIDCGDIQVEDFVLLNVLDDELTGFVNDFEIPKTQLSSQLGHLSPGAISFISYHTNIRLYFFSVAELD